MENNIKRVFLIVLDSFGIGEAPDAEAFGDVGSDTLGAVVKSSKFHAPNLTKLGLFAIDGQKEKAPDGVSGKISGAVVRLCELSNGKDTTIGHWEMAGIVSEKPLPTYPNGFPDEVIDAFKKATGRGVLCNLPYSGTQVLADYGEEHLRTGDLIVYTSSDSVFQIAAHEDVVTIETPTRYYMNEDKSLFVKNKVAPINSSAFPKRFIGVFLRIFSVLAVGVPSSLNNNFSFCLVTKKPGAIALQRILVCAKCTASHFVKLEIAAFAPE